MNLFEHSTNDQPPRPLAEELRPKTFKEFFSTSTIKSHSYPVEKWLEAGFLPNLILWGPPGCGKTTFSKLLKTNTHFNQYFEYYSVNATDTGIKEIKQLGEEGKNRRQIYQKKTILFLDEIHRLNKAQQDVLLPLIESGDLILIGATTENPSYELNKAILSRCRVLPFQRLSSDQLTLLYKKACEFFKIAEFDFLNPTVLALIVKNINGDARQFFNILEILFHSQIRSQSSLEDIQSVCSDTHLFYDKSSDQHYDHISAFIKSIRGSDTNAALLYMLKMLDAGEDPIYIARRLVIIASEDIGNADPRALQLALNGLQAIELIGLPEGEITLAHVITYLCSCPKSNRSYAALKKAKEFFKQNSHFEVPSHLKSGQQPLDKQKYLYPHDYNKSWVMQNYLPDNVKLTEDFYSPGENGFEKQLKDYIQWLKKN